MTDSITYEVSDALQSLPEYEWELLFANHPDPAALIHLLGKSGLEGCELRSIVARVGNEPVVVLPIFLSSYSVASALSGMPKRIAVGLQKVLPNLLRPRVLGVGFADGEWGQIGINSRFSQTIIDRALVGALDFIDAISEVFGVQVVAFRDFRCDSSVRLPARTMERFATIDSVPCCQLPINFSCVEDFLNGLPRNVRQNLNRIEEQAAAITVRYATDVDAFIDSIWRLYSDEMKCTSRCVGKYNRGFFADVCREVDGAKYILFLQDNRLIAFNLVIERGDMLVDKCFAMDAAFAVDSSSPDNNIYLLAFLEKIRYSTRHGIKLLHLGATAEGAKVQMGAYTLSTTVMVRHHNSLVQWALKQLIGTFAYKPQALCTPAAVHQQPASLGVRRQSVEKTKCQSIPVASR